MSEISIIFGKLGKGKTMALTYFAYKGYLQKRTVYSNYKLNFPFTPVLTLQDLNKCRNGIVVLDEFWRTFRSRRAMSKENELVDQMIMCSRKRNLNLYCTAQSIKFLDIDIRRICNYYYRPHLEQQTWINKETGNPVEVTALELLKIDCYGNLIGTITCDISANNLASLYDTYEEIGKIGDGKSLAYKGSDNELAFLSDVKKHPKYVDGYLVKDSGRYQKEKCDIDLMLDKRYFCEIKSGNSQRIFAFLYTKEELLERIDNAKKYGAIYCLVYPNPNNNWEVLNRWYIYILSKKSKILGMQNPSISTLLPDSILLKEL